MERPEKPASDAAPSGVTVEDLCSIASQFASQNRLREAVSVYEKAVKLFPDSLALKINLGKTRNLLKEKEEDERKRLMGKFQEERSHRDRLSFQFTSMGGLFLSKSQEDRAAECFRLALLNNPENANARMEVARGFYKANDFTSAIKELRNLLAIDPFRAEAHALLGRSLFYLKNYKAALHSIVDAMILDNAASKASPPELIEKFKYLLDKMDIHSRAERNDLVKSRLELFDQCVKHLDLEKESVLGRAPMRGLKDLGKPKPEEAARPDLLKLALRLRTFDLLAALSDENLFTISQQIKEIKVKQGELVFDEADESDMLYLLESGQLLLQKQTPFGPQPLSTVLKGDFFGEMNFIDPASRSADAVAVKDCALFALRRGDVEMLFDARKEVAVQFYWHFWKSLSRRTREANNLLKTFFAQEAGGPQELAHEQVSASKAISIDLARKLKLLQERGLSAKELRLLAAFSVEELYNRDELIFREGDVGDRLYIILDGKVRITKHIPGAGEEALAILGKGDFFGEMALIDNEPRSADAKAHANGTTVLTISREVLNEILSVDIESAYQFLSIMCRILTQRLREINLKIIQWRLMSGGF